MVHPARDEVFDTIHILTPKQGWEILSQTQALLVDVRTQEERESHGQPDITSLSSTYASVPWRLLPDYDLNDHFAEDLEKVGADIQDWLFICKAGVRSEEAALHCSKQFPEKRCYNIAGGTHGVASVASGWISSDLPWRQK